MDSGELEIENQTPEIAVLINETGGSFKKTEDLTWNTIKSNCESDTKNILLWRGPPDEMSKIATQLIKQKIKRLVIGGGDGTISSVANKIAGTDVELGILPLGTLNHFAKDNGIPLVMDQAINLAINGNSKKVDVAKVNDEVFLNNSSIGLYPRITKVRNHKIEKLGMGKLFSLILAAWQIVSRMHLYKISINVDGKIENRKASFVFVGNNEYTFALWELGKRKSLTQGSLSIYLGNQSTRWALFALALRGLFNRLDQAKDFKSYKAESLTLNTKHRKQLLVSLDGEVKNLQTPLNYQIYPQHLRVVVPD
ncbi:MAG: YegS/Rv2252/BmrU family lipid kinase [Bdellovibrionota bacterium]